MHSFLQFSRPLIDKGIFAAAYLTGAPPSPGDERRHREFGPRPTVAVGVWSWFDRRQICSFASPLSIHDCGERLELTDSRNGPIVLAQSIDGRGLFAYRASDGERLWHRPDLRPFHTLQRVGPDKAACIDDSLCGPLLRAPNNRAVVIDPTTGWTLRRFPGAVTVAGDARGEWAIVVTWSEIRLVSLADGSTRWTRPASVDFPHAAFGRNSMLVAADPGTCCFAFDGTLLWSMGDLNEFAWNAELEAWVAITFCYQAVDRSTCWEIRVISEEGEVLSATPWPDRPIACRMSDGGEVLLTGRGTLLRLPTLEPIWQFAEPAHVNLPG